MNEKITHDRLASVYLKIRDRRRVIKREFDEQDKALKEQQEVIKDRLKKELQAEHTKSKNTEFGSIILAKKRKVWVSDWEQFHKWMIEYNHPEMLTRSIHQSNMMEYMDSHPNDFPPTVNMDTEIEVRITPPRKKKET